jgi:hypothetical protein
MRKLDRIRKDHFETHEPTNSFDVYCVAHTEEYHPKYLGSIGCHSYHTDNMCSDECHLCTVPCPIEGCNKFDMWDDEVGMYKNDPKYEDRVSHEG